MASNVGKAKSADELAEHGALYNTDSHRILTNSTVMRKKSTEHVDSTLNSSGTMGAARYICANKWLKRKQNIARKDWVQEVVVATC